MWYNRISEYLISRKYENNELFPCVFIKKSHSEFAIIAVYVNDMNFIWTLEELKKTASHLKCNAAIRRVRRRYCDVYTQVGNTLTYIR